MALQAPNLLKRFFTYAIARQKSQFNGSRFVALPHIILRQHF